MIFVKKLITYALYLIGAFLLYAVISIIHATFTDYAPEGITLMENNEGVESISDSVFTFLSWNVGYGGLGAESDFFYHGSGFLTAGDKMVRSPKEAVEKNLNGALQTLKEQEADFYLLQEVDIKSKRSYFIDQWEDYQDQVPGFHSTMAINLDVKRSPVPILQPWKVYGKAYSGLGTLSRYKPSQASRHQLPGYFSWPDYLFLLDRCLAVHHYPTANGNDLVVINLHNSAYDSDGSIKGEQMDYLKGLVESEYQKGNYIIVGGDWNQCPPGFPFNTFRPEITTSYKNLNIAADYLPSDWQWVFDPKVPTNRSSHTIYDAEKSYIGLIDYFLVSPNVDVLEVKGIDQNFQYSDHQPVLMKVRLK